MQLAQKASQLKDCPAPALPLEPSQSSPKTLPNSPKPEPASNASWIASNRDSKLAPPSSTPLAGKPNNRRTCGCFFKATNTSRGDTVPLPLRSSISKSFRAIGCASDGALAFDLPEDGADGPAGVAPSSAGGTGAAGATGACAGAEASAAALASASPVVTSGAAAGVSMSASSSRSCVSSRRRSFCCSLIWAFSCWAFSRSSFFRRAFSRSRSMASLAFCWPLFSCS
mmetsp:Transcript_38984/g.77625  ORF Transcript_38984/g.77625 Transcript_38984/m.77625 type:complete len:227 (-) Transcript_38984:104-784(-)